MAGAVDSIVLQADEIGRKNGNTHDNLSLALFETKEDSTTKVKMNRKAINIIRALTILCCISLLACLIMAVNLMKPSEEKELLAQSKKSIAIKNDSIIHLREQVETLKKEVTKFQEKAANALMEMATEKQKAADKAKQEALKEREEAEKAKEKERDQAEKERRQQISNEIDKIIKFLNDAVSQKAGKGRNQQLSNAKNALNIH